MSERFCDGRTSNIEHPTSNIQHPTSNIQHPTSNIQHPTSNIQHPTSNIQPPNCAGLGHRALPGNGSWTQSAKGKSSRHCKLVLCTFWSDVRDTSCMIWDRPNKNRGS